MNKSGAAVTLRLPAAEDSLLVVRMTSAGVFAGRGMDVEMLQDVKTALYEACYAMIHQRMRPAELELCFSAGGDADVRILAVSPLEETCERTPDARLCRCVLESIVQKVCVQENADGLCGIRLYQPIPRADEAGAEAYD